MLLRIKSLAHQTAAFPEEVLARAADTLLLFRMRLGENIRLPENLLLHRILAELEDCPSVAVRFLEELFAFREMQLRLLEPRDNVLQESGLSTCIELIGPPSHRVGVYYRWIEPEALVELLLQPDQFVEIVALMEQRVSEIAQMELYFDPLHRYSDQVTRQQVRTRWGYATVFASELTFRQPHHPIRVPLEGQPFELLIDYARPALSMRGSVQGHRWPVVVLRYGSAARPIEVELDGRRLENVLSAIASLELEKMLELARPLERISPEAATSNQLRELETLYLTYLEKTGRCLRQRFFHDQREQLYPESARGLWSSLPAEQVPYLHRWLEDRLSLVKDREPTEREL